MKKIYLIIVFLVTVSFRLHAQGVIDFDSGYRIDLNQGSSPPSFPVNVYYEKGFEFSVVVLTPGTTYPYYDWFTIVPAGYNPTPYMVIQAVIVDLVYKSFDTFGLISVDLALLGTAFDSSSCTITFTG